jgi:hypothetical protein
MAKFQNESPVAEGPPMAKLNEKDDTSSRRKKIEKGKKPFPQKLTRTPTVGKK